MTITKRICRALTCSLLALSAAGGAFAQPSPEATLRQLDRDAAELRARISGQPAAGPGGTVIFSNGRRPAEAGAPSPGGPTVFSAPIVTPAQKRAIEAEQEKAAALRRLQQNIEEQRRQRLDEVLILKQ